MNSHDAWIDRQIEIEHQQDTEFEQRVVDLAAAHREQFAIDVATGAESRFVESVTDQLVGNLTTKAALPMFAALLSGNDAGAAAMLRNMMHKAIADLAELQAVHDANNLIH